MLSMSFICIFLQIEEVNQKFPQMTFLQKLYIFALNYVIMIQNLFLRRLTLIISGNWWWRHLC